MKYALIPIGVIFILSSTCICLELDLIRNSLDGGSNEVKH